MRVLLITYFISLPYDVKAIGGLKCLFLLFSFLQIPDERPERESESGGAACPFPFFRSRALGCKRVRVCLAGYSNSFFSFFVRHLGPSAEIGLQQRMNRIDLFLS